MTLRIEVAREDVMTSRFAISPLWELTQALRVLARPPSRDAAALRPWLIRVRDRYHQLARDVDVAVLHALHTQAFDLLQRATEAIASKA